jgi:FAD:protein FMN transferase
MRRSGGRRGALVLAGMAVLLLAAGAGGCGQRTVEYQATEMHLGTAVEIAARGPDRDKLEAAVGGAFAEIARLEAMMSATRDDSELAAVNRGAGGAAVPVSAELFEVIARSLEASKESGGAFDATVGALRGVWSFDPDDPRAATDAEIAARLPLVSWKGVALDRQRRAVGLARPGMRIDLGGIAKGYAVDRALAKLRDAGVTMALVNAGGDLAALGPHGDRPWSVGLQDPRRRGQLIARLAVQDQAVATSGDYERFFVKNGVRMSHILDPRTGRPATGCRSVSVFAPAAWQADAFATAIFVLGPGDGMALARRLGLGAVIIDADGRRLTSPGLAGRIEWLPP